MNPRFGFKDIILVALMVIVLVSLWLAMFQFDRQWEEVQKINASLNEQSEVLIDLKDTLQRGLRDLPAPQARDPYVSSGVAPGTQPAYGTRPASAATQPIQTTEFTAAPTRPVVALFQRQKAAQDHPQYARGGWFIDRFRSQVGKLTPLVEADLYQTIVANYVVETLITRDPYTLEWQPLIAKTWSVSKDGLTYRYELHRDVLFSDGMPLTSEDVVYSFELIMDPEINSPRLKSYYANIDSVEAQGPYAVEFKLKEPYFLGLSTSGGMDILPKHYYQQFSAEEINTLPGLLLGSGPYMLPGDPEDWQPGERVELVRNPNYWGNAYGARPTFDRLVWMITKEENAAIINFKNGELDRYGIQPDRYPILIKDEALRANATLHSFTAAGGGYRYIGWNQQRDGKPTKFADVRVRRALTMLTDRQRLADELLNGQATVAAGPFDPTTQQSNPIIEPWPYDPQQAQALLRQAGWWDRDGDGLIENDAGEKFVIDLIYPAGNAGYRSQALFLKDSYAGAGIVLQANETEWNTMLSKIKGRQFDAISLGWGGAIESDPYQIFHSDQIDGGNNATSYANPELDALIEKARITLDEEQRNALWHQVHQHLHDDQPYTFLFNFKSNVLVNNRIGNVQVTKTGLNPLTEQFVPKDQQRFTR